jgi:hypothetical protein
VAFPNKGQKSTTVQVRRRSSSCGQRGPCVARAQSSWPGSRDCISQKSGELLSCVLSNIRMTAAFALTVLTRPWVDGPVRISARPLARPSSRKPDSRGILCRLSESAADDSLPDSSEPSVDAAPAAWAPKLDEKCTYCHGDKVVECPVCRYRSICSSYDGNMRGLNRFQNILCR